MTSSQMRIAETIDAFYGDAGAKDGVSRSYKQAVEDLDAETIKALDGPYRYGWRKSDQGGLEDNGPWATADRWQDNGAGAHHEILRLLPRRKRMYEQTAYSMVMTGGLTLATGIKKRSHKLLDYDALRAKVKRLVDKPDKDVTKLPRAEKEQEMARAAYEQLNEQLSTELPQLIDLRVPYLDPSFEALVKIQLRFCAEAYSRMAQVQQYLDAETRDQYAQGQLDARVEQVLQEIRELSISGTV